MALELPVRVGVGWWQWICLSLGTELQEGKHVRKEEREREMEK